MAGAATVALLAACSEDSDPSSNGTASGSASGSTDATGEASPTEEPNAYRRSSRHVENPCTACVSHNRNRYYATAQDAEADAPHDGCGCEVRGQVIDEATAAEYFADGRTVYDKRTV